MKLLDKFNIISYTIRHKTQDTRHKHWQLYTRKLYKHTLVKLLPPRIVSTLHYQALFWSSQLYYLISQRLSKLTLVLIPLLLLPYSANIEALSAITARVINGSGPYFTFDNDRTKVITTEGLLGITLSDGTIYTPANNSSANTPIELPNQGETFADIQMLVPVGANSIELKKFISIPYSYWRDDDGDGQEENGIDATGNLSVSITDIENKAVSRSDDLEGCRGPYKLVLTSTGGNLITKYGVPKNTQFSDSSATYYISPKSDPELCYVKPELDTSGDRAGPANIWNPKRGFIVQSTAPSLYGNNFPTTGGNNLYFDLDTVGNEHLTWPAITKGGITVTMAPTPGVAKVGSSIRVTLTGPVATSAQQNSNSPEAVSQPSLPQEFEVVGYDSSHKAVIKYGFVLKQWFVHRGHVMNYYSDAASWCSSIGYRVPQIKDLTNALPYNNANCDGGVGATPSSTITAYQRNINAGFLTEWGYMPKYTGSGFRGDGYWSSDSHSGNHCFVSGSGSMIGYGWDRATLCVYP